MLIKDNCYATDRPDYFWPVKGDTVWNQEDFTRYNIGSKFKWIFFLGLLTHVAQIALTKYDNKIEDIVENPRTEPEEMAKAKAMEAKIKKA